MSFKNVNQAEQVARNEMEVATARVLSQMGFSHGTSITVDLLSDIAIRYMRKMCSTVRSVTDHCGRTSSSLGDVEYAFHKLSVDVDEMNEFMRQNLPIPARPVPRFPAPMPKKESKVAHIAPQMERPEHFPSWAPPVYTTGVATIASNSYTAKTSEIDAFPDFSACSATSLGLNKNREKTGMSTMPHKSLSRPASSASFFQSLSRTGSRNELHLADKQPASVDSRPGSSCSNASGAPMFKRRKRKLEQTMGGPSTSGQSQSALQPLPEQRLLITAKDLAMDHRPIMNAVHSGRAAPPIAPLDHPKISANAAAASVPTTSAASATVAAPSSAAQPAGAPPRTTRFFHEHLSSGWTVDNLREMDWKPGAVAPVEVMQYAIMRHILVYGAELPEELQKAFEFINTEPEPVRPPTPPPAQVPPTPCYRIVPVEPVQEANTPAGTLPPLKIRISKNSISCEPSPATLNGTPSTPLSPSSPQAKKHKHKKKKKHKKNKRRESEECQIVETPKQGGGLRLKIRFGGPPEASSAGGVSGAAP